MSTLRLAQRPFENPADTAAEFVATVHRITEHALMPWDEDKLLEHWTETFTRIRDRYLPLASPAFERLLRRLTDTERHPRNGGGPYCEWCGVPMAQPHRIGNDCPVALAQQVMEDMKNALPAVAVSDTLPAA